MPKDTPDDDAPSCSNKLFDCEDGLRDAWPKPAEPPPNAGLLPKAGGLPKAGAPAKAGVPPNDGAPPKLAVPPNAGLLKADDVGEPKPVWATLSPVG